VKAPQVFASSLTMLHNADSFATRRERYNNYYRENHAKWSCTGLVTEIAG